MKSQNADAADQPTSSASCQTEKRATTPPKSRPTTSAIKSRKREDVWFTTKAYRGGARIVLTPLSPQGPAAS